jgi:hypothetical protein
MKEQLSIFFEERLEYKRGIERNYLTMEIIAIKFYCEYI